MRASRRKFILTASSAVAVAGLAATPVLAASATRRFSAILGRRNVGETSVTLTRNGDNVIAEIDARLAISILGLFSFDYHLASREVWRDGVLQEIRSITDNDGSEEYVNADRIDGGIQIDASGFQGVVPGNPATTSYFTADFMQQPTWISTQSGKPLALTISNQGLMRFNTSEGDLECTKYTTRGRLNISLYYDRSLEWVGSSFNIAGRAANIRMTDRGKSFNAIWAG